MRVVLADVRVALAHFELRVSADIASPVTGIFGPSAAGKTSLLEAIAGLRPLLHGRITIDDVVVDDRPAHVHVPPRLRHIGYVPQANALFPHMTAGGNIRYGASGNEIDRIVDVLEIRHVLDRGVTDLSGGEQKRVALARALVSSPRLLLLDEPLAGLDRPLHERITVLLRRIRDELGVPMLYVTHDANELMGIAETTIVLDRGRVVASGPTAKILELPYSAADAVNDIAR
jgi:molybdate transport system ATP-binding protein